MSVEKSVDSTNPEFIREKMPSEDIFANHRIRQYIPFFRNPAKIWQETLNQLRERVYGKNYETATQEEIERLLAAQGEISAWLKGQVIPQDYQPDNAFYVGAKLGDKNPALTYHRGFFKRDTYSDNEPYSYLIKSANEWPADLNQAVNGLAKNYNSFFLLQHSNTESLWFIIHPDNTYDLKIKFSGMNYEQHDTFEPSALPLSQMPQKECSLLLSELHAVINVKDSLVTPGHNATIRNKTTPAGIDTGAARTPKKGRC